MKIEFFDIFFKFDPEIHVFLYFWMNLRYLVGNIEQEPKISKTKSILEVESASMIFNTKKNVLKLSFWDESIFQFFKTH